MAYSEGGEDSIEDEDDEEFLKLAIELSMGEFESHDSEHENDNEKECLHNSSNDEMPPLEDTRIKYDEESGKEYEVLVVKTLERLKKIASSNIEHLRHSSHSLSDNEEFEQEMKNFEIRIRKTNNPIHLISVILERGMFSQQLGLFEQSIKDFNLVFSFQKYPRVLKLRGCSYNALGKFNLALDDFTWVIQMGDIREKSEALAQRGLSYYCLGEFKKAVEDCNESIRLNPEDYQTLSARGFLFGLLGDNEKAITDLTEAIRLNHLDILSLSKRGDICHGIGELENAIQDYTKAIEMTERLLVHVPEFSLQLKNILPLFYCSRGSVYRDIKEKEKAISDFNEAIRLDQKYADAYTKRGCVYFSQLKFGHAKKDLESTLEINPSDEFALCSLGSFFLSVGDTLKGNEFYKKAVEENSNNISVYRRRFEAFSAFDGEREIEDFFRIRQLQKWKQGNTMITTTSGDEHQDVEKLNMIYRRLSNTPQLPLTIAKPGEENFMNNFVNFRLNDCQCLPFSKDKMRDESLERKEIEEMKRKINENFDVVNKNNKNIQLFRFLGSGAFCSTYLCRIFGIESVFVIKVVHCQDTMEIGHMKKMKERDCVELPYHRNISMVLSNFDRTVEFEVCDFPDYSSNDESVWKMLENINFKTVRTPLVLMKYYRKTLSSYVKKRREGNSRFEPLELCYMLNGLLKGICHLHENMIVHRDLHEENVFVDPTYGRIYIGDFGCCLDRRNSATGFLVEKNETSLLSLYYSFTRVNKGGGNLAPEVVENASDENARFIDYTKNDLFSVGMLGYFIIASFKDDLNVFSPFGTLDGLGRKQDEYVELSEFPEYSRVSSFVKKLLLVDPKERIGYLDSIKVIEDIQKFYVEHTNIFHTAEAANTPNKDEPCDDLSGISPILVEYWKCLYGLMEVFSTISSVLHLENMEEVSYKCQKITDKLKKTKGVMGKLSKITDSLSDPLQKFLSPMLGDFSTIENTIKHILGVKRKENVPSHWGVVCDECDRRNWMGERWKCKICDNYDMCGNCYTEKNELHDPNHEFEKREGRVLKFFSQEFQKEIRQKLEEGLERCKKMVLSQKVDSSELPVQVMIENENSVKYEIEHHGFFEEDFEYHSQLKDLVSMGFKDTVLNKKLLIEHNGNVRKVLRFFLEKS